MALQEPVMFCGTLRENVDPMNLFTDHAVQDAVNQAGLKGKTLDTKVGVSGEGWSVGEKQLVCVLLQRRHAVAGHLTSGPGVSSPRAPQKAIHSLPGRSHCIPRRKDRSAFSEGSRRKIC
jgi:hypothetical protein